jgi:ATP/maltotriose-dependent transcriptional regulator MalT
MEGSPPERDVLLATKLQVPRSRPGLVPRRRLADRLEEGLNRGLVLVAAPAGYGKSVLLSEWVRGMTEPVAWLSLDGGDNDPVRFWRHVLAALDIVRPGIAERVSPLAGPPAPPAYDALVSALINEVAAEPDQSGVLLVLDDYHLISSDSVQASVRFLLAHRPPQLRVVLASRSDPPLGLARYRGRGELGEVRAADLRFNLDEAAGLLRQASADLDLSIAAALAERTEGWAVGLQLAALSLRTQPDVARFVAAFTGSHRYVLDYLTEEVLSRQRQDLRNFLLETSVLERLSGSLCNAVTGRDDSQDLLEEVDRSGLFVVQLDDVRGWWRYHHLFADLLRTRLEQDPEHARRLHRNAAGWYERQDLPDEAIRHALAAGEKEGAARLVEEHFDTVFNLRGEQATIQAWLPALPENLVRSRPRLLLAQAQMASMRGDLRTMEPLLEAAELVIDRADEEPFQPSTGPEGVNQGITLCRQFVHTPPLAAGLVTLAWIRRAAGDRRGARHAMAEAESVSAGPAGLLNPVPAQRARLLLAQGDVARAARWTSSCGLGPGDPPEYPREPEHLVLARLLLAQDRADLALALLDRLETAAAAQQRAGSLIEISALRAMALAALDDEAAAIAALTSALDLGCPQGYVRAFADEGPAMAAVLGRLIPAQRGDQRVARIPLACLARLQRAFADGQPASGPVGSGAAADPRAPRLIEQLTSRELEVLAMLAAGRSNQGIASHLVISLDTVKKHVSHLMGKLGAANRTEAVARGRELGLID